MDLQVYQGTIYENILPEVYFCEAKVKICKTEHIYPKSIKKSLINFNIDIAGLPYPQSPHPQIPPTSLLENIHAPPKKFPESSKPQNLNLPHAGNYLHSSYL